MPRKVLEGCQWGSAVPRTVLAPLTGPQIMVPGIYLRVGRRREWHTCVPFLTGRPVVKGVLSTVIDKHTLNGVY